MFSTIAYLQTGNARQQAVYRLLRKHRLFDRLAAFGPVLAGTIPIGIDVAGSDLDVLCCVPRPRTFKALLRDAFASRPGFEMAAATATDGAAIVCRFTLDGWPVELFGQNCPATQQRAYRHMLIEHRILQEKGDAFRQQIIALKRRGLKTEPAFAALLGIAGDPYVELLKMEQAPPPTILFP
ncbi:MAG: DUF4269 domain-containing protein [Prevotellaceae bacterium]|jgi:hypothetical protein|nr:DUF4269 domain-containing protein [Prevotellaceae bacterium]